MTNRLKPMSEFSRNVLTLMTGTTIAQAIPIAVSPILTRIYTPSDFGILALFVAITSIFGSIANGRYELAIMLPEKDEDAINIFALGFLITLFVSMFLFILVLLFKGSLVAALGNESIGSWLYLIPAAIFFSGLFNILNYYNNRKKNYKDLAQAAIWKSVVLVAAQLSIGFIKQGAVGLISGQLLSQLAANTKLLSNIVRDKLLMSRISKAKILELAKRYKKFPKFSVWAILANVLSEHLINIFISTLYSVATLGFYSMAQRLLGVPSSLIGSAIGQVFFQEATKEKHETGQATNSFVKTVKKLLAIGIPFFGILFFTIEDIFAIVFGEKWRIAGAYAQIIVPLYLVRFIVATVSPIDTIMEKQNIFLIFNMVLLSASMLVIYLGHELLIEKLLAILTISLSLVYLAYGYVLFLMAKNKPAKWLR